MTAVRMRWLAGTLVLAGCAHSPAPDTQMSLATASLLRARQAEAERFAPVEMGVARDKLHRATVALIAKDHDGARRLAEQAHLDALLALVRTESAQAHRDHLSARADPCRPARDSESMRAAADALARADAASAAGAPTLDVDHLAYLAHQRVAIARETGRRDCAR